MKINYEELSKKRREKEGVKEMVTISVIVDDVLCEKVRAVLEPHGITLEEALRSFLEYCGDPQNEKEAIEMIRRWIEEDRIASEQIPKI